MQTLSGKTAVITGGSRGIGKAIALQFAKAGADIALVYHNESAQATETISQLTDIGCKVLPFAGDVCLFNQAEQIIQDIHRQFGHIDILVNNAGITRDALMLRMTETQWDSVINTDLKSAFNFIHACTPIFVKQRSGNIINISSVVGIAGQAGQANYAAAKAGIIALTKSMAQELGSRKIRVNAIAPGFIETDMTATLTEEQRSAISKLIALKRMGTPEDIANCALFLASDQSSYITGQTIVCDGGMNGR